MNDFMIIDDLVDGKPAPVAVPQTVFLPGRAYRRSVAGQPCPACGVRMHHLDVVAVRGETDLTPLHIQCATAIAERAGDTDTSPEETYAS